MAAKAKPQAHTQKKAARPAVQHRQPVKPLSTSDNTDLYWMLSILVLTLIAFWPAFSAEFTNWDDPGYVVDNQLIRHLSFPAVKKIFSTFVQGNYHPLTVLSYAIEYHFFELSPKPYHVVNVCIHILNALLVFRFVRMLTGKQLVAGITALLFAVHPMHVESVAWVSERKDVMYVCFFMLSVISYICYTKEENKAKFYIMALGAFLLSLLSKGQAVTLPLVLLLVDYYKGRELTRKVLIEKIPFFILSLGFGILAVIAQKSSDAIQDNQVFSFFERILFASYGMLMYILKLVVPAKLSCFYPYPVRAPGGGLPLEYYVSPLIAIALMFGVYRTFRKTKVFVFGFLFFLVTIVLVLQLLAVGSTIMSDRYSYLPYVGLFFIIGYGFNHIRENNRQMLTFAGAALAIYILAMVFVTVNQSKIWQTSMKLWTNVIGKYPQVPVAHNNKGLVYKSEGKYDLALQCYNNALVADANYQGSYENRGNIYFLTGKYDQAITDFNKALQLKPKSEVAFNSRGAVFFNMGQYDKALSDFNKAVEYKSDYPEAYRNRGNVYSVLGQYDKAIEDYKVYLSYDKKLEMIYYWKGLAELNLKRYSEAIADFSTAVAMKPAPDFYINRAKAYEGAGDFKNALIDAENAKTVGGKVDEQYINNLRAQAQR